MQDLLRALTPADYAFLVGVVEGPLSLTNDQQLRLRLAAVEEDDTPETRAALAEALERAIRYLGSADVAYFARLVSGREPGVPFREIVRDVAKTLKVSVPRVATEREMLAVLVEEYATQQFADLSPEEQQALLENLGVDRERASSFLKRSAGVFALPALIQAFGVLVVDGLIKTVIFGVIVKIVGRQLATRLLNMLLARFPWWVGWIGPVAWSLSIGWTALDLQGPAYRKTIPVVLYLGLCVLREREPAAHP